MFSKWIIPGFSREKKIYSTSTGENLTSNDRFKNSIIYLNIEIQQTTIYDKNRINESDKQH